MILIMQVGASQSQIDAVTNSVKTMGLSAHIIQGEERTIVAVVGDDRSAIDREALSSMDGVERMMAVLAPYKIASREVHRANTVIPFGDGSIGKEKIAVIAGPRTVKSLNQLMKVANVLKSAGINGLMANIFGQGASPYDSQGLQQDGYSVLAEVRKQTGLVIVSAIPDPELVPQVTPYTDAMMIYAHHMQNYPLLNAAGISQQTTLLTRGLFNTMEELLMAAEYILSHGNREVMLVESGIRTVSPWTDHVTFDVNAISVLKGKTHLPILVNVSQAAGHTEYVESIARGAIAAGADGLILEVEDSSDSASENPDQKPLSLEQFAELIPKLRKLAVAVGRSL